jgi:hypothetical protein
MRTLMTDCTGCDIVDVLLVEDDPGDILMTGEAFEHYFFVEVVQLLH